MKPRSGASRDPMELRQEDLDMDIESILDAGHENQPAEKQVDADFFNGADSESPIRSHLWRFLHAPQP